MLIREKFINFACGKMKPHHRPHVLINVFVARRRAAFCWGAHARQSIEIPFHTIFAFVLRTREYDQAMPKVETIFLLTGKFGYSSRRNYIELSILSAQIRATLRG